MEEIDKLLELSPLLLLALALNVVGLMLKSVNWHPDRLIPLTLPVLGAVIWPFLAEAAPVSWVEKLDRPWLIYGLFGLVAGAICVWGHQAVRQMFGWKDAKDVDKPK